MLIRDADAGPEVFVMRRTTSAVFAAGMYVFPGGKVDEVDGSAVMDGHVSGLDDAVASARLGVEHGGLAYWVAAVRECFEEAGVLLAHARGGGPAVFHENDRRSVHGGDISMAQLCHDRDLVLDLGGIRYVSHWVTPVGESPRRFDTRFFLTAAPADQEGLHDDAETVDSRWVRPGDAIARAEAGELQLMPPTIANLRFLADHDSVDATLAAADLLGPPPRIQPRIRRDADGRIIGVAMPGDPDFDDLV